MIDGLRNRARRIVSSKLLRSAWFSASGVLFRLKQRIEIGPKAMSLIRDLPAYRPVFHPWELPESRRELRLDDPRSVVTADRKYILLQLLRQAVVSCAGDVAECGVYKGGTAYLLAAMLQELGTQRQLHLLDSFEGMPKTNAGLDAHQRGEFAETSLASVRQYLSSFTNLAYVPGFIPGVLADIPKRAFCFVHVDLDLYDAIYDATAFFYPLVERGGFLVYDDYGFASCVGARTAVDRFYEDKPEVPLVLPTGQCIIIKT